MKKDPKRGAPEAERPGREGYQGDEAIAPTRPRVLFRRRPEDFRVTELPVEAPSGDGPHTWLLVEKIGTNTHDVGRQLARDFDRAEQDVGWAGRKDRHAVATQWFSLPDLDPRAALAWGMDDVRVLEAERHRHRLRLGDLAGNRFELTVQVEDAEVAAQAGARLAELGARGFHNRFGAQRFGHETDNVKRGAAVLSGDAAGRYGRRDKSLFLSALQAAVFHRVLEERAVPIDQLRAGELAWVHGAGVAYSVRDPSEEAEKLARFEISPSGPLFGPRMKRPRGACLEEELRALAAFGLPPFEQLELPRGVRMSGARRSLRARLLEPTVGVARRQPGPAGAAEVTLCFTLEPGSYATVLLEALFPDCEVVEARGD